MTEAPWRPSYISPSSFMLWREDPVKYWLRYLAPAELKPAKFGQTPPMAVGTVFDVLVKYHLEERTGQTLPADLLEKTVEERYLGRSKSPLPEDQLVLWEGTRAYLEYKDSPAMRLMLEGVTSVEVPMEGVRHITVNKGIVPIWGKPDAELWRGGRRVIMDWKVQGAFNMNRPNPEVGWKYQFTRNENGWTDRGPHHRSIEPLELLSAKWAIQCMMYAWMLGEEPGSDMTAEIHKVVIYGQNEVEVLVYRSVIGRDFQLRMAQELALLWEQITTDTVLPVELRGAPPELLIALG